MSVTKVNVDNVVILVGEGKEMTLKDFLVSLQVVIQNNERESQKRHENLASHLAKFRGENNRTFESLEAVRDSIKVPPITAERRYLQTVAKRSDVLEHKMDLIYAQLKTMRDTWSALQTETRALHQLAKKQRATVTRMERTVGERVRALEAFFQEFTDRLKHHPDNPLMRGFIEAAQEALDEATFTEMRELDAEFKAAHPERMKATDALNQHFSAMLGLIGTRPSHADDEVRASLQRQRPALVTVPEDVADEILEMDEAAADSVTAEADKEWSDEGSSDEAAADSVAAEADKESSDEGSSDEDGGTFNMFT